MKLTPTRIAVLRIFAEHGPIGSYQAKERAERTGIRHQNAGAAVVFLETNGLINPAQQKAGKWGFYITDAGRAALKDAEAAQ